MAVVPLSPQGAIVFPSPVPVAGVALVAPAGFPAPLLGGGSPLSAVGEAGDLAAAGWLAGVAGPLLHLPSIGLRRRSTARAPREASVSSAAPAPRSAATAYQPVVVLCLAGPPSEPAGILRSALLLPPVAVPVGLF